MIKHGLISNTDAETIEKTLRLVLDEFKGHIHTLEVGVNAGETSRGINEFITNNGRLNFHTGIDNQKDFRMASPFYGCHFVIGDSVQIAGRIHDSTYHFCFIDACHSFHRVIADMVAYMPKVIKGGYLAFHDTGRHIKPFKDYQGEGNESDPRFYIQVREALRETGLLHNKLNDWELIFDEFDENNEAGGICVFKKIA